MPAGESSVDDRLVPQCSSFESIPIGFLPLSGQGTIGTDLASNPSEVRLWHEAFAACECLAMGAVSGIQRKHRPVDIAPPSQQKDLSSDEFMCLCHRDALLD